LKITCHQSPAMIFPPSRIWPPGLHPRVEREDPDADSVCRSPPAASRRCASRRARGSSVQHHAEESGFEKDREQHLEGEQRAAMFRLSACNRRQLVPNWNDMVMPVTTPMTKVIANTLVHGCR